MERSTCNVYGKEDGIIKNNCDIEKTNKQTKLPVKKPGLEP